MLTVRSRSIQSNPNANRAVKSSIKAAVTATCLLGTIAQGANAGTLSNGSVFSLFLECNNDGIAQVLGATANINGWQYTSDAIGDNTDGHFYDILGMATRQIEDEVVVVLNGNTPLTGTGYDRQGRSVVWGDLFFSSGGQNINDAASSGNLYGIHFADTNESRVGELGVYRNVVSNSVAVNNFGHRTLDNYINLIDSDPNHSVKSTTANFFGDIQSNDLSYFNPSQTHGNVIGQGDKVGNDGFALLDLSDALLSEFDVNYFDGVGDNLIAFKFNQSALQYQPPVRELATDLEVDWIWDDRGISDGEPGFNEIDAQIGEVDTDLTALNAEIKPRQRANNRIRKNHPGYAEAKAARDARNSRDKAVKQLNNLDKDDSILNILRDKQEQWESLTPQEQENAPPELVWTRKDQLDLEYQEEKYTNWQQKIADINAEYTSEELASAKTEYNRIIGEIRETYTEKDANGENYLDRERALNGYTDENGNKHQGLTAQRKAAQNQRKGLVGDRNKSRREHSPSVGNSTPRNHCPAG